MLLLWQFVSAVVVAAVVLQVALVAYLLLLTGATVFRRRRRTGLDQDHVRRFAVLVPAHNEEAVLGRLLTSLSAIDYPTDAFDVCVVADNCTDSTAAIARRYPTRVYERNTVEERAKGFALRWLLEQLDHEGRTYDAYVIVDADSIVASNFLEAMNHRLAHGARAIQAYYSVLNADQSAIAGLRYAALAAVHYLRPLGRSVLGLSCGLKGNGMCFDSALLREFTWRWFTLAEDVEFHLALVSRGIAVEFAPETWVKADMPVTFGQSATQNARWEQGRVQLIRRHVPPLVWQGIRHASWLHLDAAVEQLIPPLSVPFALGLVSIASACLLSMPVLVLVAAACLSGYVVYVVSALALIRAPLRTYVMLGLAPVYIAWKVGLYGRALFGSRSTAWIRTARV